MSTVSFRNFTGTGAENYQRDFVPAIAEPVSVALLEAADLQPGERVLDVACGTGVIARLAAEKVGPDGSVTGIDVSPDMIGVAKSIPLDGSGSNIEWHVADAISLPLETASFDIVLCQMGLMFMGDRPTVLAEMRRVLAPGGRVVINTPGAIQPALASMEEAIIEHISPELGGFVRAVFSMHDPEELAVLLRQSGFAEVTSNVTNVRLRLAPPADFLWQYINLTPMGPVVAQASEEAQMALERQVVESWQPFVVDDHTLVDQPMVQASGRA